MKVALVISLFSYLFFTTNSIAANFKLDEAHSYVGFKIRHMGFSNVRGKFNKFSGSAVFDEKTDKLSNVQATIEVETIDTNEPNRDKHLRAKDFFEVKKYKQITFVSTEVVYKNKVPTQIKGKLTIRGITLPVTLTISEWGGMATDAWDNKKIAFEARGKIDRRKFGLTWNKGMKKIGGLMVGNDVTLVLELQGMKID